MATVVYRNAVVLINGSQLEGALHELGLDYSAEMLDETTFGDDTRINKGGLKTSKLDAAGFFDNVVGLETLLSGSMGVDDSEIVVFPDGITEGALSTGMGYAMKGVIDMFNMGGAVGALLDMKFSASTRGIEA